MNVKRYAAIGSKGSRWDDERVVAKYLPENYTIEAVVEDVELDGFPYPQAIVVSGRDVAGWTLDGYVLPRLASGLIRGIEIDLSHPLMKRVEVQNDREPHDNFHYNR